jgi:hypothetical protein
MALGRRENVIELSARNIKGRGSLVGDSGGVNIGSGDGLAQRVNVGCCGGQGSESGDSGDGEDK